MGKSKSIIVDCMDNCFVCGSPYVQIHHCIHGTANRRLADKYGLVVPLCQEHHLGNTGVHKNSDFDVSLKRLAQEKFEAVYGANTSFQEVFGKNYSVGTANYNNSSVKKDCFAYGTYSDSCSILNETVCRNKECKFYKTWEQFVETNKALKEFMKGRMKDE